MGTGSESGGYDSGADIIDQFVEQDNDNYSTRFEIRIADTK